MVYISSNEETWENLSSHKNILMLHLFNDTLSPGRTISRCVHLFVTSSSIPYTNGIKTL